MRFKTILTVIVVIVLTAVVAVAVILKSMDFNEYRGIISQEVHKVTGRVLKINGELDLKLSFSPAIAVNDVSFANASWGSRPEMVKIKRLEIVVNLFPLIFGDIRIKRFVLIEPDIFLETNAKGRGNWVLGKVEKPSAKLDSSGQTDKQDAIIPLINDLRIKNATLTYRDGQTQKTINLSLNSFKARSADLQSPFYLDIDGAYNKHRFEITAELGSLEQLINPTVPYPIHLKGQSIGTTIRLDGTVKMPMQGKGFDLAISAKGKELTKLVELAELPQLKGKTVPRIGPFDISAHVTDLEKKLSVTDIKAVVGKSDFVLIKVNGAVKNALEGKGLDLTISVKGKELTKLVELAELPQLNGKTIPQIGPFDVTAHVADPGGKISVTNINVTAGKKDLLLVSAKGNIKDVINVKGINLVVSAKGEEFKKIIDLAELSQLTERKLPGIGPFNISANIIGTAKAVSVSNINVNVGRNDLVLVKVTGSVKKALKAKGLDLSLYIEGSDISKLIEIAEVEAPLKGSFLVSARLTDPNNTYTLNSLQAKLGSNNLKGRASAKFDGKRPLVNVFLDTIFLDLNQFKSKEEKEKKKPEESGKKQERIFTDDPFPLEGLKAVDAVIKISNGTILSNGLKIKNLKLDMTLKRGNLSIKPLKGNFMGGSVIVNVSLKTPDKETADIKIDVNVKKVNIAKLLMEMKVTDLISKGDVEVKANIEGRGKSMQTLMAGLNGNVSVIMGKGQIENKYVDFIAADLVKLVVPGAMKKNYTMVNCFVARFDIKNGLAESKVLLFDTDNITISGEGEVDLSTEKLNLSFNPKPKRASLISIAIPINIRGTLAEPSIKLDTASVAKKVVGGILGSIINPAAILIPLVNKGTGDENPCLAALSQSKKTTTTEPASQKKQEDKKPADDLKDVLESLGKGFGGLFK